MFLEFSHIIAFSVLFVNSLFDIFSEKGDVPSIFSVMAILSGLVLHGVYSIFIGSVEPFYWMFLIGSMFSLYGWFAYWAGMWGGADALAMMVLGFAAPYSVHNINLIFGLSVFVNIFLLSSIYSVVFILYKLKSNIGVRKALSKVFKDRREIFALQILLVALFALSQGSLYYSIFLFVLISLFITIYNVVKSIDGIMEEEISISELEEGDIVSSDDLELNDVKKRNLIGKLVFNIRDSIDREEVQRFLTKIENKIGYSEIVGINEDQIINLKSKDLDKVHVKGGLRLIPVFPLALLVTEAGFTIVTYISFL